MEWDDDTCKARVDRVGIAVSDLAASERFYRTVLSVLGAEPSHADAELVEWIDGFGSWLGEHTDGAFDPVVHATATNVKRFVRTLHLALCSRAHRRGLKHDQAELAALDTARRFAAGPI